MSLSYTLTRPDDWHIHLRDGEMLSLVLPDTARVFARGLVMPNLKPPIVDAPAALDYQARINNALTGTQSEGFTAKMALYLTSQTTPAIIYEAAKQPAILAIKWYPAGATTNSDAGVSIQNFQQKSVRAVIASIEETQMVLSIHGEVVDATVDIFDREKIFLQQVLTPLLHDFPNLRVVLEHISSRHAVEFINTFAPKRRGQLAATITAHHMAFDRNAMLVGGIRPHYYCLPILKRADDQKALVRAAVSGNRAFFLGTDSAPHAQSMKEHACGCAGAYTAPVAMPLYAKVFESADRLSALAGFASQYGADFYRLPPNRETLTLIRQPWQVPAVCERGAMRVVPFLAGETLDWQVAH